MKYLELLIEMIVAAMGMSIGLILVGLFLLPLFLILQVLL